MTDQWFFKSETYDNCNCQINCGCQFNLPSTNGYCQSAYIGHIVEGHFNDTPLVGLNWGNCSPLLGQNPVTSPMPAGPVAGKRVGRHGAIEPSR